MKKVSVIIPTRNKLTRLLFVLRALESQVNDKVEVVVVFDGCEESIPSIVKNTKLAYKPDLIILKKNRGRAVARNIGIRKAKGEIIIFLDDDRIPGPDFILRHIEIHEKKRCAVIGKRYNIQYDEDKIEKAASCKFKEYDFQEIVNNSSREKYDFIKIFFQKILGKWLNRVTFTTGNSSVRKEDLIAIGMFDKQYSGWGVEDVDLGYRLSKHGIQICREYSLINYHLLHPVNLQAQKKDYWKNFSYFANKIQNDKLSLFVANLVNLFSPYN